MLASKPERLAEPGRTELTAGTKKMERWFGKVMSGTGTCQWSQGSVSTGETHGGHEPEDSCQSKDWATQEFKLNTDVCDLSVTWGRISGCVCWSHLRPKPEALSSYHLAPSCKFGEPHGVFECCEWCTWVGWRRMGDYLHNASQVWLKQRHGANEYHIYSLRNRHHGDSC